MKPLTALAWLSPLILLAVASAWIGMGKDICSRDNLALMECSE